MKGLILILVLFTKVCYANLELLISAKNIEEKIVQVAKQIDQEYEKKELVILCVMKGGICLTADLMRHITIPFTLEYVRASSYGLKGKERGELVLKGIEEVNFSNKDLLIVDDIFDSGMTMSTIVERISKLHPKSVKSLVLLDKKVEKKAQYRPDYVLFEIENSFVVGYGMDYKEYYRGLSGIYSFANNTPLEICIQEGDTEENDQRY